MPLIKPELIDKKIPDDYKTVGVKASMLVSKGVRTATEVGLWQMMTATRRQYGLEVNNSNDER